MQDGSRRTGKIKMALSPCNSYAIKAEEVPASVSRPTTTFDEYMDSKSGEQKGLTEDQINPKIAVK